MGASLNPALLKGKARTVYTDVLAMMDYDGVKKAILSQYSVSPERCRAHTPADLSM